MRHALSLVLGLILAPLIYIAAGYAAIKLAFGQVTDDLNQGLLGLAAAALAGALFAVLVMARLSPNGPVLAGLLYLGVTVWWLLDSASFYDFLPKNFIGEHGVLQAPAGWGTALLAVPLIATVFSPRRWRAAGPQVTSFEAAPAYGPPQSAAPYYPGATTPATTFEPPVYTPQSAAPTYSTTPTYEPPTYIPPADTTIVTTPTQPADNS